MATIARPRPTPKKPLRQAAAGAWRVLPLATMRSAALAQSCGPWAMVIVCLVGLCAACGPEEATSQAPSDGERRPLHLARRPTGPEQGGPPLLAERPSPPLQNPSAAAGRAAAGGRGRLRAAVIALRFFNRPADEAPSPTDSDHLRLAAVFADLDRRDLDILYALVGTQPPEARPIGLDTCAFSPAGREVARSAPVAWMQLLDVGDVRVLIGDRAMPAAVSIVPSILGAVRGVRYDAELASARTLLSSGALRLRTDGGDGVPAIDAAITVPRPLRITRLAGQPVRAGGVEMLGQPEELHLTWGTVDGRAELELRVTADLGGEPAFLRCRLRDDGAFVVPSALLTPWRAHRPRAWLVSLDRRLDLAIAGLPGLPLRVTWSDHARLQVLDEVGPPAADERRPRRSRKPG